METKKCNKCNEEKILDDFYKDKTSKDGLNKRCKICAKIVSKNWTTLNIIKHRNNGKAWRNKNPNHDKNYKKFRRNNDPLFKLMGNIRNLIYVSLKGNKSKKLRGILCCSDEEFKTHLEKQFESWMTWDNYGLYNGELNYGWDIDHIIPVSSAKTNEELIGLHYYKNLQPLCSYVNRHVKRDKISRENNR